MRRVSCLREDWPISTRSSLNTTIATDLDRRARLAAFVPVTVIPVSDSVVKPVFLSVTVLVTRVPTD
jgi:hypothetical protein